MTTTNHRRQFLKQLAASVGAATLLPFVAKADAPARAEENDPTAMALGFKKDTTQVDGKKYPQHKPDQKCVGCALYTGNAGATEGPCGAFGGKLVPVGGWCMAFAKKP